MTNLILRILLIVVFASVLYSCRQTCGGMGDPNRYEKMFFKNGQLKKEGQMKMIA